MIEIREDSINLNDDKTNLNLPFLWLRDNCQCDECRIKETQEKQFLLHSVPVDIKPKEVKEIDNNIKIIWPDDHETIIPIHLIKDTFLPRYPNYEDWPCGYKPTKYKWEDFLDHKYIALKALKDLVAYGAIILNKAPQEPYSLELLSKRLGPINEVLFERIHNVSVTGHVYNVAHTSKGLPPHNDFASYKSQPSIQVLHMLENECDGGESIIIDGWQVIKDLKEEIPEYFSILKTFNVPFREFDDKNETYAEAPLINCANDGTIQSFRFSNQLMQMIDPRKKDIKNFYMAYHELSLRVHDKKYHSTFRLNGGEALVVASLRVLHGRKPFVPNGKRHLQDAYFTFDNAANNIVLLSN